MLRAHHRDGSFWLRRLATAALAALALSAPPSASAAVYRVSSGSFGHPYGGSFYNVRGGNSHFQFQFGGGHAYTVRPYLPTYYAPYLPVFVGVSPYNTGVYASSFPLFASQYGNYPLFSRTYRTAPSTVYIVPTPVERPDTEPTPEAPREKALPAPTPSHPYDDPVTLSPEKGSLDEALAHIRTAWLRADAGLLSPHLPSETIALYHDGELRRELDGTEFMRLTRDAVRATRTLSFQFTEVRRQAADEASATAVHTYAEAGAPDSEAQTVTLRYELLRRNDVWTLHAVYVSPSASGGETKP